MKRAGLKVLLVGVLLSGSVMADNTDIAKEILRLGGTGQAIDRVVSQQAEQFTQELTALMRDKYNVELPAAMSSEVMQCFVEKGSWSAIEPGVAQAYVDALTENELGLLLSYYQKLEIPPSQGNAFKDMQEKMPELQKQLENIVREVKQQCANEAEVLVNQLIQE